MAAALLAAVLTLVPGTPATAQGEVSKQGSLGQGYFFVATDGGIFNYGDSKFFGSTGNIALNKPIVGAEKTPTGEGYWLVASDGGIFAFGDATFVGSAGDISLNKPIVAMAATPTGKGYWLFASDGGIFNYGDAEFYGSAGNIPLNKPIVGMAALADGQGYYLVATDGGIFSYGKTPDSAPFFGSAGNIALNKPVVGMGLTASNQGYYLVASDGGIFSYGDAVFHGSAGGIVLNKPIVGMEVTPNSPVTAPDFKVNLKGTSEVPGPGDPDAKASIANFDVSSGDSPEVCFNVRVDNISTSTAMHLHRGNAGVKGPIVLDLGKLDENNSAVRCVATTKELADELLANPQGFYVNVHTTEFPDGAARGQLAGHTAVGLTNTTGTTAKVVLFNTERPEAAAVLRTVETGGAPIVGLDFRPGTTDAYLLLQSAPTTLVLVKSTIAGQTTTIGTVTLANPAGNFGMDFNPVVDRIRLITEAGENYRINPDTAATTQDTNIPAGFAGAAYTNNFAGAPTTTLYDITFGSTNDTLFIQGGPDGAPSPNGGSVTAVGALGVDLTPKFGFDIAKKSGTAFVAGQLTGSTNSVLLAVDLATGKATNLGQIDSTDAAGIQAFSILF